MLVVRYFLLAFFLLGKLICGAQTGPGGIGANDGTSTLRYWIDANNGLSGTAPITSILDLSGNNVTNTINGDPALIEAAINSRRAIRFNGNDEIATSLTINAGTYPYLTIFAVYVPSASPAGSVWGEDNGDWDRFLTDLDFYSPYLRSSVGAGYDHPSNPLVYDIPNLFTTGVPTLSNVIYREDELNGTGVRINGSTVRQFTSTADNYGGVNGYSNLYVGAIGSNGFRFNGDIAEVIIFSTAISTAQQLIIENYLSAKYNIPIVEDDLDIYVGDDLGFDFDVAGIGRVGGAAHSNSRGTGIVQILSPNNLDDDEFLMWGHNNGTMAATNPDVPNNMTARSNRIWYVNERNLSSTAVNVGRVDIRFNLANLGPITTNHLRLLVDTDGDGSFADEVAIGSPTSLGNNIYEFNNLNDLADGVRFTIGTTNSATSLPVELTEFNVVARQQDGVARLSWETAMEKNNSHFEIFRSANARDWSSIGKVDGAGNLSSVNQYTFVDVNPINGQSYYFLRQVDWDGNFSNSNVRALTYDHTRPISVFPNPAVNEVMITGSDNLLPLRIFSLSGLEYTDRVEIIARPDNAVNLDINQLPPGDYVIVTPAGRSKLMKSGN